MRPGDPVHGPNAVIMKAPDGKLSSMEFTHCVIACGYESGRVASLAGIGNGKGLLSVPLPVEPK